MTNIQNILFNDSIIDMSYFGDNLKEMDTFFTDTRNILPIRFFYKIPSDERMKYEKDTEKLNDPHINLFMDILTIFSPEKYYEMKNYSDTYTYFSFCGLFISIHPIIIEIIENNNLYEKYPEYTI